MDVEAKLEEIIQPVMARITAENEERVIVHDGRVEVAGCGNVAAGTDGRPGSGGHTELVEVVQTMDTVVAAEKIAVGFGVERECFGVELRDVGPSSYLYSLKMTCRSRLSRLLGVEHLQTTT